MNAPAPYFLLTKEQKEHQSAYHEAGHAVANVVLNRQVTEVVISSDDSNGSRYCSAEGRPGFPTTFRVVAITLLAARFSEEIVAKPHSPGINGDTQCAVRCVVRWLHEKGFINSHQLDEMDLMSICSREQGNAPLADMPCIHGGLRIREEMACVRAQAQELINQNKTAVEAVVEELLKSPTKKLTGSRVHSIAEPLLTQLTTQQESSWLI